MKSECCPMAALVEARQSGRIGEHELPALERHLLMCPECAELSRDLARLSELARRPVEAMPELERKRARLRLLREAADLPPRRSARTLAVAVAFAAVAAGVAVVGFHGRAARPAQVALSASAAPSAPAVRTVTVVRSDDGARFARSERENTETVALESGTIEASVRPLRAGERFVVETMDAEVEVRGTVFRVRAEDHRLQSVDVSEGKVEVRFGGEVFRIGAGGAWAAPARPPLAASSVSAIPTTSVKPSAVSRGGEYPSPSAALRRPLLDAGAGPSASDESSSIFDDGVRTLGRGDYDAATRLLAAFRERAPNDPRAEDAAFLTVLALQRSGRAAAAKDAARRYLDEYPRGHRAVEAKAITESR